MRRLLPCVVLLFALPASPAQQHDDRSPTFPKFESSAHVSDKCMACARILDCLKEGLLPRDASERMSTKRHVQGRRIELGERALREAIHFSSYRAAIEIDEWMLPPLNLTAIRERFENPEGTMLGAPVRHAELAAPPKKPPKDEV